MPIYICRCNSCSRQFEKLVGVTREQEELKCPHCSSADIKKEFAPFSVGKSSSMPSCSVGSCQTCCPGGSCDLN